MEGYNWFELYENNPLLKRRFLAENTFKVYFYGVLRITRLFRARNRIRRSTQVAVYFTLNQKKSVKKFCNYETLNLSIENRRINDYVYGILLALIVLPIMLIHTKFNWNTIRLRKFIVDLFYYTTNFQKWKIKRLVVSSNLTPVERSFIQAIKSCSPKTVIWLIPHGAWMKSYTSIFYEDVVVSNSFVSYKFYSDQSRAKVLLYKNQINEKIRPFGAYKVGLSINGNTSTGKLEHLLFRLEEPVLIKMHPNMGRINMDLSGHEVFRGSLEEFFDNICVHMCGNSTMHLDSIHRGVYSMFVDIDDMDDEYNFLSSGLVQRFDALRIEDIPFEDISNEIYKQRIRYETAY